MALNIDAYSNTYSTELLFLRYKIICRKAVKLGNGHYIFLGHAGYL